MLGLLFMASPSRAEGRARVALVRTAAEDALLSEATTRLSAELAALGFEVVIVDPAPGGDARASAEAANLSPRPFATLSLSHEGAAAAADVYVEERLATDSTIRHVEVTDVSRERGPSVLAVRAVELLRASLLETALAEARQAKEAQEHAQDARHEQEPGPKPPPSQPKPPAPERREEEPPSLPAPPLPPVPTGVRAELGVAMLSSLHGAGPAFAPVLRVGYATDQLGGRISVIAPAFGSTVNGDAGSASVRQELAVAEFTASFPRASRLAAVVSAGGGVQHAHVRGKEAAAPFAAASGDTWAAVGIAGAGVSIRLGERAGLLLDGQALFRTPALVVRVGDESFRSRTPAFAATAGFWEAF
jgi:hypothetical protein